MQLFIGLKTIFKCIADSLHSLLALMWCVPELFGFMTGWCSKNLSLATLSSSVLGDGSAKAHFKAYFSRHS
jgi:hypothetical protein